MTALNPKTQLTVKLDKARVSRIAKAAQMTSNQLTQLLEAVLNETLDNTMFDVLHWINRFVPRRTGQLRESLLRNMQSSRVRNGVLRFIIGTHLNYAARVSAMSTSQVRHSSRFEHSRKRAYAYYYGHYGRIFLYDPEAIGGFWGALLKFINTRIKVNLRVAMLRQYGRTKLPWVVS